MKKLSALFILLIITFTGMAHSDENVIESDMLKNMQQGDKAALLMVHFGTSYDNTRALTIEALNKTAKETFPELGFAEAYTSRIIINILAKRGVQKETPLDALLKLRSEGYTHVVVQSSNIIEGAEMESLRRDIAKVEPFFKEIRIGLPLLSSVWDAFEVAGIMGNEYSSSEKGKGGKEHFIFVGHGTYTPSTAIYSQMDYIFKSKGYDNFHVATLEGFPTKATALAQFENQKKIKGITLVPFMFVAGDHAQNDIACDWKEELEDEGYTVTVVTRGLGELPQIRELFINHIKFALHHRHIDIMEKKAKYASEK